MNKYFASTNSFLKGVLFFFIGSALTILSNSACGQSVYNARWIDITNATLNVNNSLTVNAGTQWGYNKGANSSNILPSNTDGWVEFTAGGSAIFVVGFSTNESIFDYNTFSYGIRNEGGSASTYETWVGTSIGTYVTGNIFRVSREGSQIKYYKNGTVVRTVSTNPSSELRVRAVMMEGTLPLVTTSRSPQLIVKGTVTGVTSASGTGSITLDVKGGATPYTYSWTGGITTSTLVNKTPGTYSVTVTDANALTTTTTFRIGYKTFWKDLQGVTETSNILTKGGTAAWDAGANSSNFLQPNTDGWVEFVSNLGSSYMVGFSSSGNSYTTNDMTFGFYNETGVGNLFSNEQWTSTLLGSFFSGDIYRIAREGSQIKYYRNGTLIRTISTNAALGLSVKVLVYSGSSPVVNCSMGSALQLKANVSGIESLNGKGSISITALGGTIPYTYLWSSGETTASITGKAAGSYSVTVSDAIGRSASNTYSIAYKSIWLPAEGISDNGGALTKTGSPSWGYGSYGSNYLPANTNGWIEFVAGENATYVMGLSLAGQAFDYSNLSYGFRLDASGELTAYQDWVATALGSYQAGDVLKIARLGTQMIYYKNGTAIKTLTVNASQILYTKAAVLSGTTPAPTTQLWIPSAEGDVPDLLEFRALKDLYDSLGGPAWTNKTNWPTEGNWPTTADHQVYSTWFGIVVKNSDVVELNFPTNKLTGKIPNSIRSLYSLKKIYSNGNAISGLPRSLNELVNLHYMHLRGHLIAQFPNLSGLVKLDTLTMSYRTLSIPGYEIPQWITSLTNLVYLNLAGSRFNGIIPDNIGNLDKLRYLSLQANRFTGVIPSSIVNLQHLEEFYLTSGQFSPGPIPEFIGNLNALKTLVLACNLTGQIPSSFGNLINLTSLNLSGNHLSELPMSIGNLTNLTSFSVSSNDLTSLPASIGNLTNLTFFNLTSNSLTNLPTSIGNLTNLTSFNVASNDLTSLPTSIGSLTNLNSFTISGNRLTSLPATLNQLKKLQTFQASNNNFNVNLPDLSGLVSLASFDISENVSLPPWSIPAWLTSLTSLQELTMVNTNLKDAIPSDISKLTQLVYLDLHSNQLSGSLPSTWTVNQIYSLDLSYNQLSGSLPDIFQNWSSASGVYLSNNKLSGILPPSLSQLGNAVSGGTNLWDFDISNNLIDGVQDGFWSWANKLSGISFDGNNLRRLPPIPGEITWDNGLWLSVVNNQLDFSQMNPIKALSSNFILTPQNLIHDIDTVSFREWDKLEIPSRPKNATTTINWFKKVDENWIDVTTQSEDPTLQTFLLSTSGVSNEGQYYWSTTDTQFPDVIIKSKPITVKSNSINGIVEFNAMRVNKAVFVSTARPATSNYSLVVGGDVLLAKLSLKAPSRWPDYVFSWDYNLLSINELSDFINQNGHLPNIPSADEMREKQVYSVAEMDANLLEKIEELTLYAIDLNEELKGLTTGSEFLNDGKQQYNTSSTHLNYRKQKRFNRLNSWFTKIQNKNRQHTKLPDFSFTPEYSFLSAVPSPTFEEATVSDRLLIAPIKTVASNYKLVVGGNGIATGIDIKPVSQWPDYVFKEVYKIPSLHELDLYIKENHHLPNLPSSKQMDENEDYSLGQMDAKLLEKTEELTLYTIQLKNKLDALKGNYGYTSLKRSLFSRLLTRRDRKRQVYKGNSSQHFISSMKDTFEKEPYVSQSVLSASSPLLELSTLTVNNSLCIACTGAMPNGYKLAVGGFILAAGMDIKAPQQWPDYVFEKEYPLLSLDSVKEFIAKNGHLPNLSSAKQMTKEGHYDVAQMDAKLLEKIEEITLYLIDLDHRLSEKKVK